MPVCRRDAISPSDDVLESAIEKETGSPVRKFPNFLFRLRVRVCIRYWPPGLVLDPEWGAGPTCVPFFAPQFLATTARAGYRGFGANKKTR
jgi:hypothetical protein